MNKYYKKLELDKILELLAEQTYSDACREKALKLKPSFDEEEIRTELKKTDDAFKLSAKFGTPRFRKIKDLSMSLRRCKSGSALSFRELLDVADILRETNMLCDWFSQCESMESSLAEYFRELYPIKQLEQRISESIISEEEMSDAASAELSSIRKRIVRQGMNIREQLDKLIKSRSTQKFLQEAIVTMRDGRYVVPVRSEYKNEVAGLVHDTSATGQTFFIEPMSVVEANNEIRVLKSREQAEIERITLELSGQVGENADSIANNFRIAQILELYFAKANLGAKMRGAAAKIVSEPRVVLNQARHPLINPDTVVPISVEIGGKYESLIITGPNTGGKTVAIKTVGLLTLMTMCGLMIPAGDGSEIGIFGGIYVDIGDEQSIEQNLSTFSAHMTNIVSILKECDERSLLLFDELGAGTDPTEGAALAISIIEYARQKGAIIAATTHYAELKVYATNEPRVQNASCEFDVETLRPTYHLLVGIPGKSNAFAISKRLGLGEDIIEDAKNRISTESASFEATIEKLEQTRMLLEKDRNEAAAKLRQAEENAKKSASLKAELEVRLEMADVKAKREAERIIADARAAADETFAELDEMRKHINDDEDAQRVNEARSALRRRLNEKQASLHPAASEETQDKKSARPVVPGDTVEIKSMGMRAEVVSVSPDRVLTLRAGIMNVTAKEDEVLLIEGQKAKTKKAAVAASASSQLRTAPVANEIDLRGMETLEGVIAAERYIDSAVMGKLKTVTIIHGKGTGALRAAIQQMLKRNKCVKSFRLGRYGEGETGVTVVELK